jgi:hypothetical protein
LVNIVLGLGFPERRSQTRIHDREPNQNQRKKDIGSGKCNRPELSDKAIGEKLQHQRRHQHAQSAADDCCVPAERYRAASVPAAKPTAASAIEPKQDGRSRTGTIGLSPAREMTAGR